MISPFDKKIEICNNAFTDYKPEDLSGSGCDICEGRYTILDVIL